jgi:hypothetical protein
MRYIPRRVVTSNFRDPRPDADDTRIAYRGFQKEKEKKKEAWAIVITSQPH